MSVSFDARKMEQVASFVAFLEVLSKPESVSAALKDLDARIAELKELNGARTTIVEAEKWADSFEAETRAKRDAVDAAQAKLDEDRAVFQAKVSQAQMQHAAVENQLKERAKELDERKEAVEALIAAAMARAEELVVKEQELAAREKALAEADEALKVKAAKLQELMGA